MTGDDAISYLHFNPLPPHGGRHSQSEYTDRFYTFQSTPSAWRETQEYLVQSPTGKISIHSLRMEGDPMSNIEFSKQVKFQSTPSAWRETIFLARPLRMSTFQSTPSAWRETYHPSLNVKACVFQSTPSAWRETTKAWEQACLDFLFQSTPSAWRETAKLHRKAFFISPILVQSCKKGCKRLHSAPEKMVFFEKREKNLVRNLQHLSVRL